MTGPNHTKTAWVKAMDYLARRDHSEKELREKLSTRYTEEDIENTLEEMKNRGWILPPEELSEKVTESLHRKMKGYLYILHFLQKKGLPATERDGDRELEKAMDILQRRFQGGDDPKKLSSRLKNRGFDSETIARALRHFRHRES